MKSSWMAGIMMLYVGLLFMSLVAEHNNSVSVNDMNLFTSLLTPQGTDFSNPITSIGSIITDVWQYIKLVFQIVFLWFPDLWVGNWVWFYFFVCFPVTVMMIISFVYMLRGVPTF